MPADSTAAKEIADLQKRLADLDRERTDVRAALDRLEQDTTAKLEATVPQGTSDSARQPALSNVDKIALFRSLCVPKTSSALNS